MERVKRGESKNMGNRKFLLQITNSYKRKRANGITLIALVITIIVLLILAGVTIATLTGENGILTRASDAAEQTEVAEEKEAIGVAYAGVLADNNGTGVSAGELQDELQRNGGFYVGRYEAGTTSERTEESKITNDVVVKQGAYVYNFIGWSNSNDMTNDVGGAVELARNFDTENNYTSVTSTLIYGVQWDAIMAWIEPRYKNASNAEELLAEKNFVADSTGKGNYNEDANTNPWKGQVTTTGASEAYAVNNVYDLAGNVYEWTMESYDTVSRVYRGGAYGSTGSDVPASFRYDYGGPSNSGDGIGFRVTLFLNG